MDDKPLVTNWECGICMTVVSTPHHSCTDNLRAALAAANKALAESEAEREAQYRRAEDAVYAEADALKRLAESEAQRALLVGALERDQVNHDKFYSFIRNLERALDGTHQQAVADTLLEMATAMEHLRDQRGDALAAQPPSDLVALVRAAWRISVDLYDSGFTPDENDEALKYALDTLFQNQPGWRALCEGEANDAK